MAEKSKTPTGSPRSILAYSTMIFSGLAITILAGIAMVKDPANTMTIFNIVLPVFATWVGTILAFYFGRENFESANEQVQKLVQQITPEQRAEAPVTSIMRSMAETTHEQIPADKEDAEIKLTDLSKKLTGNVSRLPIVYPDKKPKYMIHASSIDKYLATGGKPDDTLAQFLTSQKQAGFEYGLNKGYIIVSEQSTLASAKQKLENTPPCQDIFVTKGGNSDEPIIGWISNVRLSKFLEA